MAARLLAAVLIPAACLACSSGPEPEPTEQSAPLQAPEEAPPAVEEAEAAAPAPADSSAAVSFTVTDADLAAEVLPLFYQQAKILVVWRGEPRKVSLSISAPLPWKTALQLVCRFTKTVLRVDAPDRVTLIDEREARAAANKSSAGFDTLPDPGAATTGRRPTPVRRTAPGARRSPTPRPPAYQQSQNRSLDRVRGSAYRKPPQGY